MGEGKVNFRTTTIVLHPYLPYDTPVEMPIVQTNDEGVATDSYGRLIFRYAREVAEASRIANQVATTHIADRWKMVEVVKCGSLSPGNIVERALNAVPVRDIASIAITLPRYGVVNRYRSYEHQYTHNHAQAIGAVLANFAERNRYPMHIHIGAPDLHTPMLIDYMIEAVESQLPRPVPYLEELRDRQDQYSMPKWKRPRRDDDGAAPA
jgi:hypothetical protein